MSVVVKATVIVSYEGDGLSPVQLGQTYTNATGPNPGSADLNAGFNQIVVPAANVKGCVLLAPAGSTNGKTLKGVTGDAGLGAAHWTDGWVAIRLNSGDTFGVTSVGSETIKLAWF